MKPTQNDINRLKKQVQQIMKINGIDHNTWLYEQYQNYLSDNTEVITRALKELSEKQNSNTASNNNQENTIG
ncbi:hypothetical protein QI060_12570 [Staphylococcus saprophyticus]|uniref:Phage protein n=1 Tax=Staphylococcus cohnii TaxID=29382 RepID=A0ABT6J2S0_9STAP|nr:MULTISPECIES: hypothetical protein [Staphylococcus]MDN5603655.1 hypothetical protein [Staphylococcus equorum]CRV31865.1 Uncharacterised protein [Streptococcus equi subsp. equi]AKR47525.1 hypothetical protein ACO02_2850 [Staphylococcus aureus]AOH63299.1 hypothetical protein A7U52_2975 [Staphylococcus aureus]AUI14340.1 hypothetical protein A7U46_015350 [Staphylococcus aureus]